MQSQQLPASVPLSESRQTRLGRQRQVVTVLTRHGFGLLVQRSPVPLSFRGRLRGHPESLRRALEELGPTFIKLGQILSTRPDILPDDYLAALSSLQDDLPSVPYEAVRELIRCELGALPEELFASFSPLPLATASIGQVHQATLHDGEQVAVKVQKPGIAREIELDLQILRDLVHLAGDRLDAPLLRNLEEVVSQFSDTLRDELDYLREGRNAERFARLLAAERTLVVPRVFWEHTTARVLTMERIQGAKINDLAALADLGVDRRAVARQLAGGVLRQIFEHGFFHADPHPGNYFVLADGRIGMVDYGMVGTLDAATRRDLLLLLAAWVRGDAEGLAEGLMALGLVRGGVETARLRADMRRVLGRYHDAKLQDIHLGQVTGELFRMARRYRMLLRGDLALLAKTVAMHEGLSLALDPEFRVVDTARPYVEAALRRLSLPRPDAQSLALNLQALLDLTANLPQRTQRLLGRLERGDLGMVVRPEGVDPLMRDLNSMVNRLSVSILAAAFIVGLALLLQVVESSHGSVALLFLFAVGLVAAGVLGFWLLLSMYRAGRSH